MEGILRSGYLIDHGYGFATAYREEAESHLSEEGLPVKGIYCEEGQPLVPVLFEIQIGRSSLYLPAKDEPDPFGLRTGFMLERQSGQFILERYSMLKIREVSPRRRRARALRATTLSRGCRSARGTLGRAGRDGRRALACGPWRTGHPWGSVPRGG